MHSLSRRNFVLQSAALAGLASTAAGQPGETRQIVSQAGSGGTLEAGSAKVDLTPPPGIQMWGYSNPEQISTGVLDSLFAKAVVFRVGEAALGIVSMDFGRMPPEPICEGVRARVRDHGISDVIFCATHTHSGPLMELSDLPHMAGMEDALVMLLAEAAGKLVEVRLGVGSSTLDISHNRRVVIDGQCWMRWRNLEKLPSGPLDQELTAIQLETPAGQPVATLVHYACHPVILASDNTEYSADWCGAMCREVEAQTGAPCLFLQGAAGDINPYYDKMALGEGAVEAVAAEGHKAAEAVFSALRSVNWQSPDQDSLAWERAEVDVGLRYDLRDPEQVAILKQAYSRLFDVYMKDLDRSLPVPVDSLVLQGDVALTFHPGEPFVQFQIDFKERSTVRHNLLCGYANDFHIYFPTTEAAIVGGYGASSATYAAVGAGERLLTESLTQIGRLTGRLGPLRGPADLQSRDWSKDVEA